MQLPHVFKSSAEFDSWFNSWRSGAEPAGKDGSAAALAAQAALGEEQLLIVTNRLHQVLRPFVLRRTKDILSTALPAKTERKIPCPMSAYQKRMLSLLANKGTAKDVKGVNNMLMEMRKICNDPMTSKLHVRGSDSSLRNHCLPSSMQLGGKMAVLVQLLHRLEFLGKFQCALPLDHTPARTAALRNAQLNWQRHRWAIEPQYTGQFRTVISIFKVSTPTIQRDYPTMGSATLHSWKAQTRDGCCFRAPSSHLFDNDYAAGQC